VRSDEAIGTTRATAIGFLNRAQGSLDALPANPAVSTLQATCDLLLERLDGAF